MSAYIKKKNQPGMVAYIIYFQYLGVRADRYLWVQGQPSLHKKVSG